MNVKKEVRQVDIHSRLCGLASGTCLRTPRGDIPVERLAPGDLLTLGVPNPDATQAITWIGRRDVILSKERQEEVPVCIRVDAFADGEPSRDLYLAQEHAIYIDGKFYLARDLVNGRSIVLRGGRRAIAYFGVQLDRHAVLLADNLRVESLLSTCAFRFTPMRDPADSPAASIPVLKLDFEVRSAMNAITPLLVESAVVADIALQPGLSVSMPRPIFLEVLIAMLRHAIKVVADSRILLTASRMGEHVSIGVTYTSNADQVRQEADLRAQQELIALRGSHLGVIADAHGATTITLRVPRRPI